ncbi:hypothetical protein [Blastopirellula retiformator]|uniref:hypothetical protein n=1 Tax=Blastopirellula retiformator TaxID=2527970 RepID=UPI0011B45019|nr:hypothetical protein [Blastopirellula retiformator]
MHPVLLENEFAFGIVLAFVAALFSFLAHPLLGYCVVIGVSLAVVRAWAEVTRKQRGRWQFRRCDATWILFGSLVRVTIAVVCGLAMSALAGLLGGILFRAILWLGDRFSAFDAVLVDGLLGLVTTIVLLVFLGPPSIESLWNRRVAAGEAKEPA